MAYIKNQKYKDKDGKTVGYVIAIQSFGLKTSCIVKSKFKRHATTRCNEINQRIEYVKHQQEMWSDWTLKEKRHWLISGVKPQRIEQESLTVTEAIDKFIEHKTEIGKARNTVNGYADQLKAAKTYFKDVLVNHITASHAQEYQKWLAKQIITTGKNRGKRLSVASQKKKVERLKAVLTHAHDKLQQVVDCNSFKAEYPIKKHTDALTALSPYCDFTRRRDELKEKKIPETTEGAFSEIIFNKYELENILGLLKEKLWQDGTAESRRLFAAIMFCAYTGTRRSELCRIKITDVDLNNQSVRVLKRKGRKDEEFWTHKMELVDVLMESLKGVIAQTQTEKRQCIFVEDDEHLDGNSFDEALERLKAAKLGRDLRQALKGTIYSNVNGWHVFRHTLASMLLANRFTTTEIEEIIGWTPDSKMVKKYAHLLAERKRRSLEELTPKTEDNTNRKENFI